MKISKHIHSCLLVEEAEKIVLLDPGNYTAQDNALDISRIDHLDAIGITHEHMDHLDVPFLKKILEKFPNTPVFSNESIKKLLAEENILVNTVGNDFLSMIPIPHEKVWIGNPVENIMITLFNRFATVGDSLTFEKSPEILALPIAAPWGSTQWAVETALKVKPKIIIPIHDFMWKDEVRKSMYQRLHEFFATKEIDFKALETGEAVEV